MPYGVGGVDWNLQPTAGRWVPESPNGITGDGHPIYPSVRSFQLTWGLMPISDFDEIRDDYLLTQITGSLVVSLPDIAASSYTFKNYSGCILTEPEVGQYFTEHVSDVTMFVLNVVV